MLKEFIFIFLFACFTGCFGSIVGIGGGVIYVPVLTLVFRFPIHQAISASLVGSMSTSITSAASYLKQKITNLRLGIFLLVFTTTGAVVGASIAVLMREWILCIIFSGLIVFVLLAPFIARTKKAGESSGDALSRYLGIDGTYYDRALKRDVEYRGTGLLKGGTLAALAGMASGMLGISGGVINVPTMNSFMNIPIKVAVATSQFMLGVTIATSAIIYFFARHINLYIVAPISIGAILGSFIGTSVMNKLPAGVIRIIFTVILVYLSYQMLAKGILLGYHITLPGLL